MDVNHVTKNRRQSRALRPQIGISSGLGGISTVYLSKEIQGSTFSRVKDTAMPVVDSSLERSTPWLFTAAALCISTVLVPAGLNDPKDRLEPIVRPASHLGVDCRSRPLAMAQAYRVGRDTVSTIALKCWEGPLGHSRHNPASVIMEQT